MQKNTHLNTTERRNVALYAIDIRVLNELRWRLQKETLKKISDAEIIRIALQEMAVARGIEC